MKRKIAKILILIGLCVPLLALLLSDYKEHRDIFSASIIIAKDWTRPLSKEELEGRKRDKLRFFEKTFNQKLPNNPTIEEIKNAFNREKEKLTKEISELEKRKDRLKLWEYFALKEKKELRAFLSFNCYSGISNYYPSALEYPSYAFKYYDCIRYLPLSKNPEEEVEITNEEIEDFFYFPKEAFKYIYITIPYTSILAPSIILLFVGIGILLLYPNRRSRDD